MNAERFEICIGRVVLDPAWARSREDLASALATELARRLGGTAADAAPVFDPAAAASVAAIATAVATQLSSRLGDAGVPVPIDAMRGST